MPDPVGDGAIANAGAIDFLAEAGLAAASVLIGIFDQSDDCIKMIDTDGSLRFMNCNGKIAMQIDDFAAVAGKSWSSLWPQSSKHLVEDSIERARNGLCTRFEAHCPTAAGEGRWWEVSVSPLVGERGDVRAILSTSRDVTERRKREEAAAIVAVEMRHRLLNAHSVGAALLHAAARAHPEHREFAQRLAEQMSRLASVQARLLKVVGGLPLAELCADIAEVFEQSGGQLEIIQLPDVRLDEDRARATSLVLGELTTNSLKHGALGRGGIVRLSAECSNGRLLLEWSEQFNEAGPMATTSTGQGAELIRRILRLFNGALEAERTSEGYRAHVSLQLKD